MLHIRRPSKSISHGVRPSIRAYHEVLAAQSYSRAATLETMEALSPSPYMPKETMEALSPASYVPTSSLNDASSSIYLQSSLLTRSISLMAILSQESSSTQELSSSPASGETSSFTLAETVTKSGTRPLSEGLPNESLPTTLKQSETGIQVPQQLSSASNSVVPSLSGAFPTTPESVQSLLQESSSMIQELPSSTGSGKITSSNLGETVLSSGTALLSQTLPNESLTKTLSQSETGSQISQQLSSALTGAVSSLSGFISTTPESGLATDSGTSVSAAPSSSLGQSFISGVGETQTGGLSAGESTTATGSGSSTSVQPSFVPGQSFSSGPSEIQTGGLSAAESTTAAASGISAPASPLSVPGQSFISGASETQTGGLSAAESTVATPMSSSMTPEPASFTPPPSITAAPLTISSTSASFNFEAYTEVFPDGSLWGDDKPYVNCNPPCSINIPPFPLATPTVITWPPFTTTVFSISGSQSAFATVGTTNVAGQYVPLCSASGAKVVVKTTIITIPPFTTNLINFWPVSVDVVTNSVTFTAVPSVLPPEYSLSLGAGEFTAPVSEYNSQRVNPTAVLCGPFPLPIQAQPTVVIDLNPIPIPPIVYDTDKPPHPECAPGANGCAPNRGGGSNSHDCSKKLFGCCGESYSSLSWTKTNSYDRPS